jgi:hypothetical protein
VPKGGVEDRANLNDVPAQSDAPDTSRPDLAPPAAPEPARPQARLRPPVSRRTNWSIVFLALFTQVFTLAFGWFTFQVTNDQQLHNLRGALDIWNRWDAPHYLAIAAHGYQSAGPESLFIVFYPLFPWAVRMVTLLVRDPVVSALLVSCLASIVAGVALAHLVAIDFPEPVAYRAVWFMFIFPTAYFFHIGYTESLFLALVVCSFLAARRDHWMAASILGALACLARMNGLLLVAALGVEALHQMWSERRWRWRWLWIGLIPMGFGVYLLINYRVSGNPFIFANYEWTHWSQGLTWPWVEIATVAQVLTTRDSYDAQMIGVQVSAYLALGLVATIASAVMLRPSYSVWMFANWLIMASLTWDLSAPRYDLALFPIFILFARWSRNRPWYALLNFWCLLSMAIFMTSFVRGNWAF